MSAALHAAALAGDSAQIRSLLAAGANPNATDDAGATALHSAALNGHLDAVNALLEAGADANARDTNGWTPIFKGAYNHELDCGYAPVVQALIDRGVAAVEFVVVGTHELDCGYAPVVQALIDAGADVNARIFYGLTPLMLAAGAGEAAVCTVLLAAGAEVKAENEGGRTALMMAKERFYVDVINLLHEAEGYVMETEGASCSSGMRKGPPQDGAQVINFMPRPH